MIGCAPGCSGACCFTFRAQTRNVLLFSGECESFSSTQRSVCDLVLGGKSVFFTGCAGSGKSYLLKHLVVPFSLVNNFFFVTYFWSPWQVKILPEVCTGVTASTGLASVNIGGCTIHSWAGIGLGQVFYCVQWSKISLLL